MFPSSDDSMEGKEGLALLYEAIEEKLISLAQQIKNSRIDLADKDDKTFDRLMKAMIESKSIAENQLWLKVQLGLANKDKEVKTKKNLVESRAK